MTLNIFKTIRSHLSNFRNLYLLSKPGLSCIGVHLTDHCNLNCKGCGHFCPLADCKFTDVSIFENDMHRMAELFSNISKICLMGGEPLLHPQIVQFIITTRLCFPKSDIHVVTNGLLLLKMEELFWETCSELKIVIDVSVYPIKLDMEEIRNVAEKFSVKLLSSKADYFLAFIDVRGNSSPKKTMQACRKLIYCPFLKNGKMYVCCIPATINYFNKKFATAIPQSGYDIHGRNVSGRKILKFLNQPSETCRFCSFDSGIRKFGWDISKGEMDEWLI